jgi:DNA recombination protein RmuC
MDAQTVILFLFFGFSLVAAILALAAWWEGRAAAVALRGIEQGVAALRERGDNAERAIREEMKALRDETGGRDSRMRFELGQLITGSGESLQNRVGDMSRSVEERLMAFDTAQMGALTATKHELTEGLKLASGVVNASAEASAASQRTRLEEMKGAIAELTARLETQHKGFGDRLGVALTEMTQRLQSLIESNDARQTQLRDTVTNSMETLRKDNEAKLEQMRLTVDEKLPGTLEKRLGESFLIVSERLDKVHQGLGEMQTLATGVGDLKRVLTNVKSRGGWAEVQLGALLENMLSPEQFVQNAVIKPNTKERVEFAIKMPGAVDGGAVLLPIDAKFPMDDYERLVKAQELGEPHEIELAAVALGNAVRREAQKIAQLYIDPPASTDFAIMYLPTEGLFAEVIRRGELLAELQQRFKVTIAGPTTLTAFLNSLQMGFRTLAVQKRSSEVWKVLGEAKAEFIKYGEVWEKLSRQLETAKNTVDEAGRRTRAVSRRLSTVEVAIDRQESAALPQTDAKDDGEGLFGATIDAKTA